MTKPQQKYDWLDLLARPQSSNELDGTGFSSKRLTAAIARLLSALGATRPLVTESTRRTSMLEAWRVEHRSNVCFRYRFSGGGTVWASVSTGLFDMLFERFYGGIDASADHQEEATKAQRLFAVRLSNDFAHALQTAWPDSDQERITNTQCLMWSDEFAVSATGSAISVIDLSVSDSSAKTDAISIAISSELIATVRRPQSDAQGRPEAIKGDWSTSLLVRAHHVRLPIRAVLARPKIQAAQLQALAPGDVLPLALPKTVTVLTGDQIIGHGVMGESRGNAAICLEQVLTGAHS